MSGGSLKDNSNVPLFRKKVIVDIIKDFEIKNYFGLSRLAMNLMMT